MSSQFVFGDYFTYVIILLLLVLPYLFMKKRGIVYFGKYAAYSLISTILAFMYIPYFALNPKSVRNCLQASIVAKRLTYIVGIHWELRDMQYLSEDRGAVIVANHQSIFDILGMHWYWKYMEKCAPIAKKELFYFWPYGLAAWLGGVVFIDRRKRSKSYDTLYETSKLMHENKTKIFVFPEGTRNNKANRTLQLLPFKKGAFKVAIACKVPILPVVYSPYYFIDWETSLFGSGKVIAKGLPPISTDNLTENDVDCLMEQTRNIMMKAFDDLVAEVAPALPKTHFTHQAFLKKNQTTAEEENKVM